MLGLFFGVMSAFLTLRQGVIIYLKRWTVAAAFFFIFFFTMTLFLTKDLIKGFDITKFALIIIPLALWLGYDIYRLKNHTFQFSYLRFLLAIIFSLLSLLFLSCVSLPHLYRSEAILSINMTAETKEEMIAWKNPREPLMEEPVTKRRVIIENMTGEKIFDEYLCGDLVSIRIKLLCPPTFFQWMGFPQLWDMDVVSADYLKRKNGQSTPQDIFGLDTFHKSFFKRWMWSFWEKAYLLETPTFLRTTATLTSTHLPIIDRKGHAIKGHYTLFLHQKPEQKYTAQWEGVLPQTTKQP
jgi:hypothetical protein